MKDFAAIRSPLPALPEAMIGQRSFVAGFWSGPRRVVAKVERHAGELYPRARFVAAAPQSDLTSDLTGIFLAVFNTPHALSPAYALLGAAVGALDELNIFGGPGFTACALLFLPPWARTIISPMQSPHMQLQSQQSWYGAEPKHGNVLVARTGPSALTDAQFRDADETVRQGLQFFGYDPILREKLRILLLTASYFDANPTRFCEVFAIHGSDKALGWHNYGFLYNYIFGAERGRTRRILEIGTRHSDGPLSASENVMPGASLRAGGSFSRLQQW